MSAVLERPPSGTAGPPHTVLRRGVLDGALEAARATAVVLLGVAALVVLAWFTAPAPGSTWLDVTRAAAGAWTLGHGGALAVGDSSHVRLLLAGVMVASVAAHASGGRRLAGLLHRDRRALAQACAVQVVVAALLGIGVAVLASASPWWVDAVRTGAGALLVAALGSATGALRGVPGGGTRALAALCERGRVPTLARRAAVAGVIAVVALVGAGSVLVGVLLVLGSGQVTALHEALDPGFDGGMVLLAGQVALLPVLAVWAGAAMAGPGVAVGEGTQVTLVVSDLGSLPALPVLGALPEPGPMPAGLVALAAVPVLCGALAGWWLRRLPAQGAAGSLAARRGALLEALGAGVAAGVLAALAALASTASVGAGRMSVIGPDPVDVGLAVAAQVALGAVLVAAAAPLRGRVAPWLSGRSGSPS